MTILYYFIHKFKSLENVGIHCSTQYIFNCKLNYRKSTKNSQAELDTINLSIKSGIRLSSSFWGEKISSLTSIIGNNGSGKSSSIEWLMNMIISGSDSKFLEGFIIYKNDNEEIEVFTTGFLKDKIVIDDNAIGKKIKEAQCRPVLDVIFYSGHFIPYQTHDIISSELGGENNISDSACLIKDLQDYSNVDTLHLTNSLFAHYRGYYNQNMNRISRMLLDKEFSEKIKIFKYPQFINFLPNKSWEMALSSPIFFQLTNEDKEKLNLITKRQDFNRFSKLITNENKENIISYALNEIFLNSILNFCVEHKDIDLLESIISHWNKMNGIFIEDIHELFNNLKHNPKFTSHWGSENFIKLINEIIFTLRNFCEINMEGYFFYITLENMTTEKYHVINKMFDLIRFNMVFIVGQFFDNTFSHNHFSYSKLSSGEAALLNLTSRLHNLFKERLVKGNAKVPNILILDEAEIGFHPEWQKMYILLLLDCLNSLLPDGAKIQIIYTTHSPISLSDLPRDSINLLKIDSKTNISHLEPLKIETFGANIFDIYKIPFFLNNSFIGDFAVKKIKDLEKKIRGNKIDNINDLVNELNIIGDKYIKGYLYKLLEDRDTSNQLKIARLEAEIQKLKNQEHNAKN